MSETKRDALDRLHRALVAREKGLLSAAELKRVETEVLDTPGVKPQNVRDLKDRFRGSLVKNSA